MGPISRPTWPSTVRSGGPSTTIRGGAPGCPEPCRSPVSSGRGGASFPVGPKWAAVGRSSRRAVVVVNAMEGEPASIKDRILCERAPHLVLDGAEVARSIIGGSEVVVCVPHHHDAAATAVMRAIVERQRVGMVSRPVSVQRPPGRYVAGEESALVGWLERGRSLPTHACGQIGAADVGTSGRSRPQRRNLGPGGPHRPTRSPVVPTVRNGGGTGNDAGDRDRRRPVTGAGGGRVRLSGGGDSRTGRHRSSRQRRPGRRLRRCLARRRPSVHPLRPRTFGRSGSRPRGRRPGRSSPHVVRHHRDGPAGPLHGRGERGTVRSLRVRPAGGGR